MAGQRSADAEQRPGLRVSWRPPSLSRTSLPIVGCGNSAPTASEAQGTAVADTDNGASPGIGPPRAPARAKLCGPGRDGSEGPVQSAPWQLRRTRVRAGGSPGPAGRFTCRPRAAGQRSADAEQRPALRFFWRRPILSRARCSQQDAQPCRRPQAARPRKARTGWICEVFLEILRVNIQ